jgi:hypothetical protein
MLFLLVQTVYWLALSTWFGGAMFIGVAWQVINRTVRQYNPVLPHVLSVNLEGQHSTLLGGAIVGNLISMLTTIGVICAGVLAVTIGSQWCLIDLSDTWNKISAFARSGLFLAATGIVIYNWRVLWPKVIEMRQTFIENADDPEKANPASERLDRLQRDSEVLLMLLVFLLLGMILLSGGMSRPVYFYSAS